MENVAGLTRKHIFFERIEGLVLELFRNQEKLTQK